MLSMTASTSPFAATNSLTKNFQWTSLASILHGLLAREQKGAVFTFSAENLTGEVSIAEKRDVEMTRCGVIADLCLNSLYFSSEEELERSSVIYHLDSEILQKLMKRKEMVCKVIWAVWEKEQFDLHKASGDFLMPVYEHTFLVDLAAARYSSGDAYIIQSAFETYPCSVQPVSFEFLWEHLRYLHQFDRSTPLEGKSLSEWIEKGLFLNQLAPNTPFKSLEGKEYIGQLISFTGYSYNLHAAVSRAQLIWP